MKWLLLMSVVVKACSPLEEDAQCVFQETRCVKAYPVPKMV